MAPVVRDPAEEPDMDEATTIFEGVLAGMQSMSWLERAGEAALPLVWSEPYQLVTRPLRVVARDGRELVRAGDRIAVTGTLRNGQLVVSAAPALLAKSASRSMPGAFFDLSPEELLTCSTTRAPSARGDAGADSQLCCRVRIRPV